MNRDNSFFEEWVIEDEFMLRGRGYVMAANDTVFIEQLEISKAGEALVYRVGLNSANTEELVEFTMTEASETTIVFENPKHDFPKRISYQIVPGTGIRVDLSGLESGQYSEIHFAFVRRD